MVILGLRSEHLEHLGSLHPSLRRKNRQEESRLLNLRRLRSSIGCTPKGSYGNTAF